MPGLGLDVHDHRGDGGRLFPQPPVHLLHRADIEIGGEDGGAAFGGDARVVARVAADVEDFGGPGLLDEFADQRFFRSLGRVVVGADLGVVAPDGIRRDRFGQRGDLLVQPPQRHFLGDGIPRRRARAGDDRRPRRGGLAGLDLLLEGERQADVEDQSRAPALEPRKCLAHLQRGTAVEVGKEIRAQVPARVLRQQQREQEHAVELAQREPQIEPRGLFDGGQIDEDGPPAHELDVVGRGILEGKSELEQFALEPERQPAGIGQHRGGPLVGIGDRRDPVMLEERLEARMERGKLPPQGLVRHEAGADHEAFLRPARQMALGLQPPQQFGGSPVQGAEYAPFELENKAAGIAERTGNARHALIPAWRVLRAFSPRRAFCR